MNVISEIAFMLLFTIVCNSCVIVSLSLITGRQTIVSFNGFIDSLYKISEVAHNTKGKHHSHMCTST